MKPTLGRIVLFQFDVGAATRELAAIIVDVQPGAAAASNPEAEMNYKLMLTTFARYGETVFAAAPTAYDPAGVIPNSWRWPPKV